MTETYSADNLLGLWKRRHAIEPLRNDCAVTRTDGIDLDAYLRDEMHTWYMNMLYNAPLDILPLQDLSEKITVTRAPDGAGAADLPNECLRIATVRMNSWERPARLITDMSSADAIAQQSEWSRGGKSSPAAIISRKHILLYTPSGDDDTMAEMLCVVTPPQDAYILTPAMLATLPTAPCELSHIKYQ